MNVTVLKLKNCDPSSSVPKTLCYNISHQVYWKSVIKKTRNTNTRISFCTNCEMFLSGYKAYSTWKYNCSIKQTCYLNCSTKFCLLFLLSTLSNWTVTSPKNVKLIVQFQTGLLIETNYMYKNFGAQALIDYEEISQCFISYQSSLAHSLFLHYVNPG